ncbi:MFS transporter [Pseudonocardia sp. TRM90224]|uniref:MFS transporter n=1 Tax=Pseudonocardia sp. TRM90224 TaxID=2812678 RepID=UPI001E566C8E|nr:MFS transporter [Pseudonocardia sp. TRM90224]
MTNPDPDPATDPVTGAPMRRVAASVLIGTTIEWYDFILYGSAAALVLGPLYFPGNDPVASTLFAFSTFAVGFLARPLGGIVLGHFGDRVGRKQMLVLSLSMMGVATFLMGLLPTYETIGVAAPILLVLLRLVQGFGVGGEWGGAVLTAVEHASPARRGFFGSLPQVGVPAGLFLATSAFFLVSQLPEAAFLSWGWRVPFLISIVLVGVGLYVRFTIGDTPVFEEVKRSKRAARVPLLDAVRNYPRQVLLATGSMISTGAYFYGVNTYALAYVKSTKVQTGNAMLVAVLVSAVVAVVAMPWFGALAQRRGRRTMIITGLAAMTIWIFPTFAAIDSGNPVLLVLAYVVGALFFSVSYGPQATFITELFDATVRFSASTVSFQLGVLLGGAVTPIVATALVARWGTSIAVAAYIAILSIVSLVCVAAVSQRDVASGSADMDGVREAAA